MTTGNSSALLGGSRPPLMLYNKWSIGGVVPGATNPVSTANGVKTLSGALTAGTLKTLLTVSGAGLIKLSAVYAVDTTARTMRLQLTIDGVVVFNVTSGSCVTANAGMYAVGNMNTGTGSEIVENVVFNSSLTIEVASSLSETDKVGIITHYEAR